MRNVEFELHALQQFAEWANEDRKMFNRIVKLITECARDPFKGTGKPEPLRGNMSGAWSRRIDQQHRLVYKVGGDTIVVIACKFHY